MAKNQKLQKGKFRTNLNKVDEYNKPNLSQFKTEETSDSKLTKKPFDKKTYRLKKYSKKYKLDQWEDNRKKAVLRDYYRHVKEPDHKFDVAEIYNDPRNRNSDEEDKAIEEQGISLNQDKSDFSTKKQKETHEEQDNSVNHKKKPIQKAHEELRRIKEAKQKKREDYSKAKAEKEEALKKYRKEKSIKYKRLSKKTKKGQPIMKDRIEMLLEKIQKSVN